MRLCADFWGVLAKAQVVFQSISLRADLSRVRLSEEFYSCISMGAQVCESNRGIGAQICEY